MDHRQMSKEEIDGQVWSKRTIANSIDHWKAFRKFTLWRLFRIR
jgi:hypothetical protein